MSEFPIVIKPRQVGLIKGLIQCIGQIKGLFKIRFQIVLHDLINWSPNSTLINILKNIMVDDIDAIALPSVMQCNDAWIAGVIYVVSLDVHVMVILGLGNGIEVG